MTESEVIFKEGDLVTLKDFKSKTIKIQNISGDDVECIWTDDQQNPCKETFKKSSLTIYKKNNFPKMPNQREINKI